MNNKPLEEQLRERLEKYGCPDSYLDNELNWWLKLIKQREGEASEKSYYFGWNDARKEIAEEFTLQPKASKEEDEENTTKESR